MDLDAESYIDIKTGEVRNAGFKMELVIPIEDSGNIDALIDQEIIFSSQGFHIVGVLEKTQGLSNKDGIYKKLIIQVASINVDENAGNDAVLMFPDKKDQFEVPVTIRY